MTPPETAIVVTLATTADLDALVPLFDGYRRFYQQPGDEQGTRDFLAQRLERGDSVTFLARLGEQARPAGFTQLYPSFSSVSMKRLWILNDLFVAPEARGRGVASALLQWAERHAAATGAKGLTLMTARDNTPAQSLYEAHGWRRDEMFYTYSRYF